MIEKNLGEVIDWIADRAKPVEGLYVPVSGGTDSALTFWLCNQAVPGKVLGVYAGEELRSKQWFEAQGKIRFEDIKMYEWKEDEEGEVAVPIQKVDKRDGVEELRWARFLYQSNRMEYGLVGSRTRTEDLLGNFSLASQVASILPIAGIWKSEVMELCEQVGVPDEIIQSSLEFDCDCGRPERLYQMSFPTIDRFLKHYKLGEEDPKITNYMEQDDYRYLSRLVDSTKFRDNLPYKGPVI